MYFVWYRPHVGRVCSTRQQIIFHLDCFPSLGWLSYATLNIDNNLHRNPQYLGNHFLGGGTTTSISGFHCWLVVKPREVSLKRLRPGSRHIVYSCTVHMCTPGGDRGHCYAVTMIFILDSTFVKVYIISQVFQYSNQHHLYNDI